MNCIKCNKDVSYISKEELEMHNNLCPICYNYQINFYDELSVEEFIKNISIKEIDQWVLYQIYGYNE